MKTMYLLKTIVPFIFSLFCALSGYSQRIIYSEPGKDDTRRMNFEIAGKVGGNFLIYKNIRNINRIAVYDNDMNEIASEEQDYLPDNDRLINVDLFAYTDFCYVVYQYQKKNIVYCMGVKVDGMGKKISDLMQLDTTQISFATNNKIYTAITSEDKSKIAIFKINSKNRKLYTITTLLFNTRLELQRKDRMTLKMEERYDHLGEFYLDNEGDLVFTKVHREYNDNISEATVVVKYTTVDSLTNYSIPVDKVFLDDIQVKVDNYNKRYLFTSFFYTQKRSNIDGLYFFVWDKPARKQVLENKIEFSEELRHEANKNSNWRTAFNDYFVRNIVIRKDGGFIVGTECYYTTSRYNSWNRYDYLYRSPWNSYPLDYYFINSPYYGSYWSRSMWGNNNTQTVRYQAENIVVFSFDKNGKLEWNNVISKDQFNDESDHLVSYQMLNTGGQLHFIFNVQEKRVLLLNDFSVTGDGSVGRNPTLKNLDKGYEFMARYGKQVSTKQAIIPCFARNNFICFAKIEFN
jgi:hypothetical protein